MNYRVTEQRLPDTDESIADAQVLGELMQPSTKPSGKEWRLHSWHLNDKGFIIAIWEQEATGPGRRK